MKRLEQRVLGENWLLPNLDHLNSTFFTAGKLMLQQCETCGNIQHPPEDVCRKCQAFSLSHFESAGVGKVASVAVNYHPVHPGMKDIVPYAIVLVSVDDAPGLLVVGNAVGVPPADVKIGDVVSVTFEEAYDTRNNVQLLIPQWQVIR